MRILLILILLFYTNIAHSEEVNWKMKERIKHDNYYEENGIETRKIKINGKTKKIKLIMKEFFPLGTIMKEKEGECRKWRIQEKTFEGKLIEKSYSLNDCLPCIDEGPGYICSYPYFEVFYLTDLYGKYIDPEKTVLSSFDELKSDGTKEIHMHVNLASRERLHIIKRYIKLSTGQEHNAFFSRIMKFNTKLRKIISEASKYKTLRGEEGFGFKLVFDRLTDETYNLIDNKGELKIREKDLKILFTLEPSATIYKFQTRD